MITCSQCGERYLTYTVSEKQKGRKYRYYICRARRFPSEFPKKCTNKIWNANKLEDLIRSELQLLTVNKEEIKQDSKKIDFTQLINNVNNKIERIIDLYADGNIDKKILDKRMHDYNVEKEEILSRKHAQEQEETSFSTKDIKD